MALPCDLSSITDDHDVVDALGFAVASSTNLSAFSDLALS